MNHSEPRISVIVPTVNEASCVVRTLGVVLNDPHVLECIVVDGGSQDDTLRLVSLLDQSRVRILTAPLGRSSQMNAGGKDAKGDVMLFLHADTVLPTGFGKSVLSAVSTRPWGCFRHSFAPNNWRLGLISFVHNLRLRFGGVAYGDQTIFIQRHAFLELDGFPVGGLEDIEFSLAALNKFGRPKILSEAVASASRKFLQIGEFKAFAKVVSIVRRHNQGKPLGHDDFFRSYR